MKVLIIGGQSSLAVELKRYLVLHFEVITAGKAGCDIFVDLGTSTEFNFNIECDIVILTAAVFGGNDFVSFEENININVIGTIRSISIAQKVKAKHFILISSMSALQDSNSPFFGIYSISKNQSEVVAEFVCERIKMPLTILRPSQLYGESVSFKKHQPLLYSILDSVNNNHRISFFGTNNSKRNYLHVNDFNEIILRVINYKLPGKFNCVHLKNYTLTEIADAAIKAFHSSSDYHFDFKKDDIVDNDFIADIEFYEKIKFSPEISMEKGMLMIAKSKGIN